jgi:phenylacetate-CoA ligase
MATVPSFIYSNSPHWLRSLAASAKGCLLNCARYGADTDRLAAEALARETWDPESWARWRAPRLSTILENAARDVPFYREHWTTNSSGRSPTVLQDWPILRKDSIRKNPEAFLSDNAPRWRLFIERTSGSTGTPIKLWQSRETLRDWHRVSRRDRWGIFGGRLVIPQSQTRPPFWVWNAGMRQVYFSSYHISAQTAADYLAAMERYGLVYLLGYPSALASLAQCMIDARLPHPSLRLILSNAEFLFPYQRELIARAFGCPVYDSYGMTEKVCGASECPSGVLHLWPEAGVYEVLKDAVDEPVAPGEVGRLVCTTLLNADMPLIRYETGDRVALVEPALPCACGRRLPILLEIDGRTDDYVLTPDGRRISRLGSVFSSDLRISEAQIIQTASDHVTVKIVPAPGFDASTERAIVTALQARLGPMRVSIAPCSRIPRSRNGKFQAVVRASVGPWVSDQ